MCGTAELTQDVEKCVVEDGKDRMVSGFTVSANALKPVLFQCN